MMLDLLQKLLVVFSKNSYGRVDIRAGDLLGIDIFVRCKLVAKILTKIVYSISAFGHTPGWFGRSS